MSDVFFNQLVIRCQSLLVSLFFNYCSLDGQLLLDLNEEDFLWLENSKEENLELTELQWKMFYSSLRSLRLTLHKAPQTLWEFKVVQ